MDSEDAVEHHVGPALCYTPNDWDRTIGLQTETMQKKKFMKLLQIFLVNKV